MGCLVHYKVIKYVKKCESISERIFKLKWELDHERKMELLIPYGPNEDEKTATEDNFWHEI